MPGPRHPPGLYAPIGQRADGTDGEAARSALNLQRALTELVPLGRGATGGAPEPYARAAERDLAPSLVLAALLLALLDLVIALALRGLLPARRLAPPATAAVLLLLAACPRLAQDEAADDAHPRPHPRDPARLCRHRQRPTSTARARPASRA